MPRLRRPTGPKLKSKSTKLTATFTCSKAPAETSACQSGHDGLLIVDDQYAPLADKIKAALKTLGEGSSSFILNTHWHGDHTGSNAAFGPEATMIAHDNVRKRLATEQKNEVLQSTTPPHRKKLCR